MFVVLREGGFYLSRPLTGPNKTITSLRTPRLCGEISILDKNDIETHLGRR